LWGGTGTGILLDVGAWIRELFQEGDHSAPEVASILLLPSVVERTLAQGFHDRAEANGAAILRALDQWQSNDVPEEFRPLMKRITTTLNPAHPIFDICYLFSATNEHGR